ncbi:MAG: chemotaxis protein CheA [Bryobacteraceae bacterium]|nr:chemotaxis protein CheA [Bryobacteraceae bacterium]
MDWQREAYREEAGELLAELEIALLELEQSPERADLIARVFRALHTIKGSGAMFGFTLIAEFTHEVETAFDLVREGALEASPELVNLTLAARDHIKRLLGAESDDAALAAAGAPLLERLRQVVGTRGGGAAAAKGILNPELPAESGEEQTFRIRFQPPPDLLADGTNPILLARELASLGELSSLVHVDSVPCLDAFDPEVCYASWDFVLTTRAGENAVRDVFLFVEDRVTLSIERIEGAAGHKRLGEILVERGALDEEELEAVLSSRPLLGASLVSEGIVAPEQVDAALLEQEHMRAAGNRRRQTEATATLRVPAAKLDGLVDVVGELVTVQARLSRHATLSGDSEAIFIAEEIERLTAQLREGTMSVRMVPIAETFNRFKRLVRDLSNDLGKQVNLALEGGETELDKSVIEQLNDPLVHLVRNAMDHGIEGPEARAAAGKPACGSIRLSAAHSGAFVVVKVEDDGAGLNTAAIRERAVARGLLEPSAECSEQELFQLIFEPGFSTAKAVSGVSGRGVGMDVVKRSIEALRGSLSLSSRPGQGTTVTLKIPLTLAIIDGLLITAGDQFYVLPLANVLECVEIRRSSREHRLGESVVIVRGEPVPYVSLRDWFDIPGTPPPIEQVIVTETAESKFGIVVDHVLGDHHTVIKKLGALYQHVEELSGATILGDGQVALILDVDKLCSGALQAAAA